MQQSLETYVHVCGHEYDVLLIIFKYHNYYDVIRHNNHVSIILLSRECLYRPRGIYILYIYMELDTPSVYLLLILVYLVLHDVALCSMDGASCIIS